MVLAYNPVKQKKTVFNLMKTIFKKVCFFTYESMRLYFKIYPRLLYNWVYFCTQNAYICLIKCCYLHFTVILLLLWLLNICALSPN